jgi:hypothetical protein
VAEDAGCGVEVHAWRRGDFDREPDPVEREWGEEDCNGEAEVVLQESRVPDIGNQDEEHADCGEDPGKPAFVVEGCVGVSDFQRCEEEVGGSLLHAWDYGYPSCPDGLLSGVHVDSLGRGEVVVLTSSTKPSSKTGMDPIPHLQVCSSNSRSRPR